MGTGTFHVSQRLTLNGQSMRISRKFDAGHFELEDLTTGRHEEWSLIDLLARWSSGELRFKTNRGCEQEKDYKDLLNAYTDAFRDTYPDAAWDKARTKLEFVFRVFDSPIHKKSLEPHIQSIWADESVWKKATRPEKMPSWSSVAGWVRKYREADRDVRALIDRVHLRGNRTERYPDEVMEIVDDFIETVYMARTRPTPQSVLEDIRGEIAQRNKSRPESLALPKPSIAFLKGRIDEVDAYDLYASRYGVPSAKLKFRISGEGAKPDLPLKRVEIDHHKMNLFVIDDNLLLPLGRPWLTLLLDACTRYVVGYYIGFEEPSSVSVARAIRNALAPKVCSADIVNAWDAYGIWETLVADNGLELHGEIVERGCGIFGMKIQYCPRKKPWYKGKVERFFRTFDGNLTASIEGTTFIDIFERGDYDPSQHAVVTLSTLRKIVEKWIVDYYHQKPHRGIGKTPAQAWEELISRVDRYLPESTAHLDTAFSRVESRKLTKDGIEFDSLFYQSEDLRRIRETLGDVIDVDIRVMDDDVGYIMVQVPHSNTLVRVPAVDQAYADSLTRWQHGICKRYKANKYRVENLDLSLYEAKTAIRALIERDTQIMKRASRTRQARFMGGDGIAPKTHDKRPDHEPAPREETAIEGAAPAVAEQSQISSGQGVSQTIPTFELTIRATEPMA
jgi:putative transposase